MTALLSWASSRAMQHVEAVVERVADCDAPVLLTGESGVGKEVVAREIHRRSPRRERPLIKVNCAAVPADLLESEMFGHERGAFTGAESTTAGKFEAADGGTLMLDEIGEMPASLQAKLLHVLEDGRFSRLGSNRELDLDVRVIAATNRSLDAMMASGKFREDLYYRLQVIEIHVPPLRERREEIQPLAHAFLDEFAAREGCARPRLSSALERALQSYDWPGNVRELENAIHRYVLLQNEDQVMRELGQTARTITAEPAGVRTPPETAAEERPGVRVEREMIASALDLVRWNRRRAAEMLGVSYKTLLNKMKALGLDSNATPSVLADVKPQTT
jgi:DNA-binding NtrC family response regulator